jgi:predicted amidohydrolase
VLLRARAIETGSFILAPAQSGDHDDGRSTYGHSMIINPWGEIIAERDEDGAGLIYADLDLSEVTRARAKIPAWSLDKDFSQP